MEVRFKNKDIEELYRYGKHRKYRLQPYVLRKFFMRIQQLEAAVNIYDLWRTSSLKFEHLQGSVSSYSVRIDQEWRLELNVEWNDDEKSKGILYIYEISKHYHD